MNISYDDLKEEVEEQIYSGSFTQQIEILKRFQQNVEERKIQMNVYEKGMSKQKR